MDYSSEIENWKMEYTGFIIDTSNMFVVFEVLTVFHGENSNVSVPRFPKIRIATIQPIDTI